VRAAEPLLQSDSELSGKVIALARDPSIDVKLQVMFTLGELNSPQASAAMLELFTQNSDNALIRDAAISGLHGREIEFLAQLLAQPGWNQKTAGREKIVRDLARCVAEARDGKTLSNLLALAAGQKERWTQYRMLDGISALIPPKPRGREAAPPRPVRLAAEPPALARLAALEDKGLADRLEMLKPLLAWPGKGGIASAEAKPLTEAEKSLFEAGKAQYPLICGACHQPSGLGLDGLAPPLADSDWTTGSPERLARIVLHGVRGPLNVKGRVWEMEMPPVNILSDQEIAALLTYIRRAWGHNASAITPDFVAKVRKETEQRLDAWTEAELMNIE
jgi:mono/diheme cytochrome c family protein